MLPVPKSTVMQMPTQAKKGLKKTVSSVHCLHKEGSEKGYFVLVPMNIHKPNGVFSTRHNKSLSCLSAAGRTSQSSNLTGYYK
jgi:hypothetical protein